MQNAFGPFYRIEQLVVSTVEGGEGRYTTPAGLPSILNDHRIKLLFDIQSHIDKLSATTKVACHTRLKCNMGLLVLLNAPVKRYRAEQRNMLATVVMCPSRPVLSCADRLWKQNCRLSRILPQCIDA